MKNKMGFINKFFILFIFTLLSSSAVLAQNSLPPASLTEGEIITYYQNIEKIVNLYDPSLATNTLQEFNMTSERFNYVDLKISTFVMEQNKIENIKNMVAPNSWPTVEEKVLLIKHEEEILKANKKLIKLLTQGIRE